jgi:hypothetical protein
MRAHRRGTIRLIAYAAVLSAVAKESAWAQVRPEVQRVSLIYSGRSLGALGVQRAQDEHELLTEQANALQSPFKLVSHMAWRAPGIVVFMPGQEPGGDELPDILARRSEAERRDGIRALASATAVLFQDPWRPSPDLLDMMERNPRRARDFPDLVETTISVSRMRGAADERVYIVEQRGAIWPEDPEAWSIGEMNRVDMENTRLFELPLNLGQLGTRAAVVRRMRDSLRARSELVVAADLGHLDGEMGITRADRARLDFTALSALDYSLLVPFEHELALGADALNTLRSEFPRLALLAANVRARNPALFTASQVISAGGLRIGMVGLINPRVREKLPRDRLQDFTFEPVTAAAKREVARVRTAGAEAVIVLSNLDASDNAVLAEQVAGIDAIVADMPLRSAPEITHQRVELPDRPFARHGAPALIARGAASGVAVGRLTLEFHARPRGGRFVLAALEHTLERVTDNLAPDTAIARRIARMAAVTRRPKGELMFPAFVELSDRHPRLRDLDDVTRQGRVSKPMWEAFMARLLRNRARAEVAVIRRLDHFPPQIGKLHENEIDAWLWTGDQIVVLDVRGGDLRALLRADVRGDLATSGIDLARGTIQGHAIDDQTYYRVATVDVLFEGARNLAGGRRVRRQFEIAPDGSLHATAHGAPVTLKEFVFGALQRERRQARGNAYLDRIAALVAPDPAFVNLLTFTFDRPTLSLSANQVRGRDGYGNVPESRVTASDSWLVGASTRFVLTQERERAATDLGISVAYGKQGVTSGANQKVGESSDDLKLDLTVRTSRRASGGARVRPFVRATYDTEVTPTSDPVTSAVNPRQMAVRGSAGLLLIPRRHLRRTELAFAVENDLGRPNVQYGAQAVLEVQRPVGVPGRLGLAPATYRFRNDAVYFLPARLDSPSSLSLRYNMIHEILVPLMDELSLSVAADAFVFRGKTPGNRHPATSVLLRVGLTYDRLWKPRYQPFL